VVEPCAKSRLRGTQTGRGPGLRVPGSLMQRGHRAGLGEESGWRGLSAAAANLLRSALAWCVRSSGSPTSLKAGREASSRRANAAGIPPTNAASAQRPRKEY